MTLTFSDINKINLLFDRKKREEDRQIDWPRRYNLSLQGHFKVYIVSEQKPSSIPEYSARNPWFSCDESEIIRKAPLEEKITTENGSQVPQYSVKNL